MSRNLVINALSALRGGGQTYIINFLKYLPEGDFKIILIVNSKNKKVFERFESKKVKIYESIFASKSIFHRTYWELFSLSSFLKINNINYYYAPGGIMVSSLPDNVITVTALRNMLPFDERERKRFPLLSYIRFKLWILRYVFLTSYRKVNKLIFISEYSKSIVQTYIPSIEEKSTVIPHGLNELFMSDKIVNTEYTLPNKLLHNKFYLYVSILDVYKAQKEIVKAWAILKKQGFEYPLALAGAKYNEYGEEVLTLIKELDLEDNVIYLGNINYNDLPVLYKASRVLIFASSCECCPNILLEKLGAKKPILCSNIEPMPEFGESAVLYFDPYEQNSLLEQINLIESDEAIRKQFSEKARNQALKFNWNDTINKTLKFIFE